MTVCMKRKKQMCGFQANIEDVINFIIQRLHVKKFDIKTAVPYKP